MSSSRMIETELGFPGLKSYYFYVFLSLFFPFSRFIRRSRKILYFILYTFTILFLFLLFSRDETTTSRFDKFIFKKRSIFAIRSNSTTLYSYDTLCVYIYMCVCLCVCVSVLYVICVCMYMYTYMIYIYIHTHKRKVSKVKKC